MTTTAFKIIGLDPERPPVIQTMPCIDLFFQLDEQAPADWCDMFASIVGKPKYPVKVNRETGLFIETWVRTATEIPAMLVTVKALVAKCNTAYDQHLIELGKIVAPGSVAKVASPEQIALDKVVQSLIFD